jgi:MerR family mercuric resistance operon transcriptional regulator
MTVGELARQAGVNVQTIRFYEREGLLPRPPRTAGGYRAFPAESVARVRFIKRAQELGFTLNDARELLELREHRETACPDVRKRAESKLADVADKIRRLRAIRRELARLAKACAGGHRSHSCALLEALEQPAPPGKASHDHSGNGTSGQGNNRSAGPASGRVRGADGGGVLRRDAGAVGDGVRRGVGRQPRRGLL